MARRERSIVEYFAQHERYRCGYCGSEDTNYSHGMWAHSMTVQDYQDLIDRGWRRSGKYCYKPTMNVTCCPMYTISCDAVNFRLSKSHKKVLKRVNRYLVTGQKPGGKYRDEGGMDNERGPGGDSFVPGRKSDRTLSTSDVKKDKTTPAANSPQAKKDKTTPAANSPQAKKAAAAGAPAAGKEKAKVELVPDQQAVNRKENVKTAGADSDLPPCRKARQLRLEKRMRKTGESLQQIKAHNKRKNKEGKSLEEFLKEPQEAANPAHRLELKVVRSSPKSPEFLSTYVAAHQVYHKYQMAIHKDPPGKPNLKQYTRFLVDSPLQAVIPAAGEAGKLPGGYGSFHQQYFLDGKLIAVGVIDILTHCVSSVYLYYDPDYSFLSLGTYSALREMAFVRELQKIDPAVAYYYMGFYIHSCPKMIYKGQYYPSFLVCPEAYTWVPIERCIPKLEAARYARLEDSDKADADGNVDIDRVLVLLDGEAMPYEVYRALRKATHDQEEVTEYASFTGMTCATRMLLFRK